MTLPLVRFDAEKFGRRMGEEVHRHVNALLDPLAKRIAELEHKLAAVEAKGIRYRGAWQASQTYEQGDLATYGGGLWHCNVTTRAGPGDGKSWTLAVKSGRDGKDGK